MSTAENLFIPESPKNVPVRPPNKGMMKHLPSQAIPPEACLDAKNVYFTLGGMKRRPPFIEDASEGTVTYDRIDAIGVMWQLTGDQDQWLIDDKFFYTIGGAGNGFTGQYWSYTSGSVSASGTAVVGTSTAFNTSSVLVGDVFAIGTTEVEIAAVNSTNSLTLSSSLSTSYNTTDYAVRRAFSAGPVDWCYGPNKVYFADGTREATYWDGSSFTVNDSNDRFPYAIAYWRKRLWYGRTQEGTSDYRYRVRWSYTTDESVFASTSYIDLPYTPGKIRKILPMGNLLYVYFSDAIYVGRPSNGTYPVEFQKIETGSIGLIGKQAITPALDGHYFVGTDDIYFISQARFERIGIPIVSETIDKCEEPDYIKVAPDIKNERIVFGFPEADKEIVKLWSFFYKTKSWSYDEVNCDAIGYADMIATVTWDNIMSTPYTSGTVTVTASADSDRMVGNGTVWASEISSGDYVFIDRDGDGFYETERIVSNVVSDTAIDVSVDFTSDFTTASYRIVASDQTWEDLPYTTWDTIRGIEGTRGDFFIGKNLKLYKLQSTGSQDFGTQSINLNYTTGDLDLGAPDTKKTFTRLSLKLREPATEDISFTISGSTDRGDTWKNLGTVTLAAGLDEVKANFRLRGSLVRFRITSSSTVSPYIISELVYRMKASGQEVPVRNA
jgi:hypothetical protein